MYFVLYEADHQNRAQALAGPNCQLITSPVKAVPGMDTLTFWGHGTPGGLCGKSPQDAARTVKDWKRTNSKIKTVEILTCNSRHAPAGSDPFIAQMKGHFGFRHRNLKIKSMPIRMGPDGMHGESILFADYISRTWCYLTAQNIQKFSFMRNVFKYLCEKQFNDDAIKTAMYLTSPPPQKPGEGMPLNKFSKWVPRVKDMHDNTQIHGMSNHDAFMKDFADCMKDDDAFRREFVLSRKYTMNYGGFDQLRNQLVNV